MTMSGLTLLLSHLLQTEVDDSGSQAEPNQGDRSPALRENRIQVSGEVTASFNISVLAGTAHPSAVACVHNIVVPTLKYSSAVSGPLHRQELAALGLVSSRAGGCWPG